MTSSDESFETRYERVAPALYSWAALTVGPALRARIDPQDLVQEASARAFEGFATFDPELGSFRSWIFRIAKNCRNEALRGAARARLSGGEERVSQCPASVTAISQRMARDDALQKLLEFVETFDPTDRELFLRCGLQGEGATKAAVRMGLGEEAVQKRWSRLRERLRDRPRVRELLDPA
jgi:RNA polymerase sigma-70 factor (ECF subfamily)